VVIEGSGGTGSGADIESSGDIATNCQVIDCSTSLAIRLTKDQMTKLDAQIDNDIIDLEEILEVMVAALNQKWDLSCLSMPKKRLSSLPVKLIDLNAGAREMTVDTQGAKLEIGTHFFRAQTGGMSYTFKTRLIKQGGDKDSPDETSYYQFKYPNLIRFSQLRDSVRIGLDDWQDIQASFFMEDAIQLQGEVVDISATGAKIKFDKDFDTKAGDSSSIADCQLLLPDGSLVLTRTQIVGTVYDEAKDISYVRCKYLGLNQYDEKSLELLISERVDELDHAKLVGLM